MNEAPIIEQFAESFHGVDYDVEQIAGGESVVTRLSLFGVRFPDMPADDDFSVMSKLKHLTELDLGRCLLTDGGFQNFAQCTHIKRLDVHDCRNLTNAALKMVKGFRDLSTLWASDTKFSSDGFEQLTNLKAIEDLILANCPNVDCRSLVVIGQFTNLKRLDVSMTGVKAKGVTHLAALPRLRELNLFLCDVDDSAIESIAQLQSLEKLNIRDTLISRRGFKLLAKALPDCNVDFSTR